MLEEDTDSWSEFAADGLIGDMFRVIFGRTNRLLVVVIVGFNDVGVDEGGGDFVGVLVGVTCLTRGCSLSSVSPCLAMVLLDARALVVVGLVKRVGGFSFEGRE